MLGVRMWLKTLQMYKCNICKGDKINGYKKDYINLIRWSCIIDSFNNHYFIRIIVLYLLSQNVTPWIAVSIPIVLEFARLLSRGIDPIAKFALKLDYKNIIYFI